MQRQHPYLASFTELCFATHRGMEVITADGYLDAGGHDDHTFRARQGLVYSIEEVRDIACQSQVTYKRKLIQPRFVPTPFCDGAFPEPTRTKIL